ncbi:acyltransferase [Frankia sp. EAN1pec]|uniref:DapH/DapD/GlmU-related protein n=1 Tax=Parafrankia sp. (strain EAN1pec) TaxID=298653 RepID=UPI0018DD6731
MAPNTSIRNGERVSIGSGTRIGERCCLWAGDDHGRVDIGRHTLLGPGVFITASNYRMLPEIPATYQPKDEKDVRIGTDVWLGAGVTVVAGVTVGDGCVVGAGAVVTRSLPEGSIAVGAPARVVGRRGPTGRTPDVHPGTGRESDLAVFAIVAATAEGTADTGHGHREAEWLSTSQS